MKKIFLLAIILASLVAASQTPPKFTKVNFAYNYVGVGVDSNLFAARYSGTPTIRFGQTGAGQLAVDTTNHIFYFYSGGSWRTGTTQWTTTGSDIYYNTGGAAIGNTSVNSKAILDLTSTSKGMLAPRMNTGQQNAIATPPSGLLIYNTDSTAFVYYNGSAWRMISTGAAGLTGTTDHNLKKIGLNLNTNKDPTTLIDGATITLDMTNGYNYIVTLGGNRTLSITNVANGDYGTIQVVQDVTGGRTLTVPSGTVALNPTGNTTTIIAFYYNAGSYFWNSSYNTYITAATDTIYRTPGKDSIQFTIGGRYHAIKDSTGGGSLTVGSTPIASGTANRLLYEDGSHVLNESANGVFDGTEARFGGITDKGAYTLQNEGGTYFYNGDVEMNGNSGGTWEVLNYGTYNMIKASGDLALNFSATGAGVWAHQIYKAGNGSGTNYATTDYFIHGATDQKWYCGPYGTLDYWVQDITKGTVPFVITSGGDNKISLAGNNTSPNSYVQINGSLSRQYTSRATGVTLDITHDVVEVTATGQTITLPTASGITGRTYTIKLTASGTCTIATTSSQTIDGVTTYILSAQYSSVTVQSNGSNWNILATDEPTGTYNPSLTNVTNVTGSTSFSTTKWKKYGNMVEVFGKFQVDPTAAAATEIDISLPIASNLSGDDDVSGMGSSSNITGEVLTILADATNDRAAVKWNATDVTNRTVFFHFFYIIK